MINVRLCSLKLVGIFRYNATTKLYEILAPKYFWSPVEKFVRYNVQVHNRFISTVFLCIHLIYVCTIMTVELFLRNAFIYKVPTIFGKILQMFFFFSFYPRLWPCNKLHVEIQRVLFFFFFFFFFWRPDVIVYSFSMRRVLFQKTIYTEMWTPMRVFFEMVLCSLILAFIYFYFFPSNARDKKKKKKCTCKIEGIILVFSCIYRSMASGSK